MQYIGSLCFILFNCKAIVIVTCHCDGILLWILGFMSCFSAIDYHTFLATPLLSFCLIFAHMLHFSIRTPYLLSFLCCPSLTLEPNLSYHSQILYHDSNSTLIFQFCKQKRKQFIQYTYISSHYCRLTHLCYSLSSINSSKTTL